MNETERKQKIYQELIEEIKLKDPRKRLNEFSCREFSLQSGMNRDKAREFLEGKVTEGLLHKRVIGRITYYSIV